MASRILSPYGRLRGSDADPIYTRQPPASPIHLTDSVLLRPGGTGELSAAALKNPMGRDMELLEIKFMLESAQQNASASVLGGSIWCELIMGGIKLTNGAIPTWIFGREENLDLSTGITNTPHLAPTNLQSYGLFSWRLPRPLFIPAGGVVLPKFTHTGYLATNINVRVGYSARTVFKKPKQIYVPWVAKYASKAFNPISAADTDMSSELDLVNSNPEVFYLQRFVGRTQVLAPNGAGDENLLGAFGAQTLNVRMTDSYGRPIVGNYTPFRSVFEANTRSWELENGASLDPGAFYRVQIRKDAIAITGGTQWAGAVGQAFVSMVGWRELENP